MREILFRGKRLDNGEWVEGAFCPKNSDTIFGKPVDRPSIIKLDDPYSGFWFDVDHATVGQYTEKTDENGKRIFEGDIFDWGYAGVYDMRYVVTYDAETASFIGERGGGYVTLNGIAIKIIGNIHDNPDLLEGGEG